MEKAQQTPFWKANWPILLVLLYLISPLDFIPDDIPLIGSIDDAGILLIEIIRQYLEHKKNAKDTSED